MMKIVKISNYYNNFFKYYYNKFPDIVNESYEKQYNHMMLQSFFLSDFYLNAFNKLGVDAVEIVYNAVHVQKAWAKEHSTDLVGLELLAEQLKFYQPDVVWFHDSLPFDAGYVNSLKKEIPSAKVFIGNLCSPITCENMQNLKAYDFVTTCSPNFIDVLEKAGVKYLLNYHAYSELVNERAGDIQKSSDIVFIGSLIQSEGYHYRRTEFLEQLAASKNFDFNFYGNLHNDDYWVVKKEQTFYILKEIIQKIGLRKLFLNWYKYRKIENILNYPRPLKITNNLRSKYLGPLYGIDMFKELMKAKLTFDIQGEVGGDYAATMRIFESAGCGVCLLAENKKNIGELFEVDKEIVTFSSFDEALEKIEWLFNNEQKMIEIGENARKRVLKDHTYENRAQNIIDQINKL